MNNDILMLLKKIKRLGLRYREKAGALIKSLHPKFWRTFKQPEVVYIIGMPRTGTTLAKRYLGEHPQLAIAPAGKHWEAWEMSEDMSEIVISKYTRNMPILDEIYETYGNRVWFLGVVRDPRDELVSLCETERHPEIPKDDSFWAFWEERYRAFFEFADRCNKKGSRVALIRYEDLVTHPIESKNAFLNWLKLPVIDETAKYTQTNPDIAKGLDKTEDWKTHRHNEVHTESLGRWQKETDEKIRGAISGLESVPAACNLMCHLGYDESGEDFSLDIRLPVSLSMPGR